MQQDMILLFPILLPVIAGVLMLKPGFLEKNRKIKIVYILGVIAVTAVSVVGIAVSGQMQLTLWPIADGLNLYFCVDDLSKLFAVLMAVVWLLVGIFSIEYMTHEREENRFFGFYLIAIGVLIGIDFAGNFVTLYIFYEMMSLTTMPLVLHSREKKAVMAGLKYLFYSAAGAFMALFGFICLYVQGVNLDFTAGGTLLLEPGSEHYAMCLIAIFFMLLGFGVKAGMFPLHGWLPTAHPVAPAPASAVLSGVITKAGVLAIIRTVYYLVGPDNIRGTWVQTAWMSLTLVTVFMGSMLAYKEKVMKKRFAYSTVSQVSYILFGLSILNVNGFIGATAHVIFHSLIKNTLFLVAGAIIFKTGKTKVSQLRGIGKEMPVVIWCFTFAALALVGIPPASGFISKWYLAVGSLESGMAVLSWLGTVVLLISALLTAGYLLPITINGFLPGADYDYGKLEKKEPSGWMLIPLVVMTVGIVGLGIWHKELFAFLTEIAQTVL